MVRAIIFDLDGTLVDSMEAHFLSFRGAILEHAGIEFTRQDFRLLFGKLARIIAQEFLESKNLEQDFDYDAIAEKKHEFFRNKHIQEVKLLPGVEKLLQDLEENNIPMAIASNSPRQNIEAMLKETKIKKYFKVTMAVDEVSKPKPHPEIYLTTAEKLGVKPAECVVVEDSTHGIKTAKNAKMKSKAVLTGGATQQELEAENPTLIVKTLEELDAQTIIRP